MTEQPTPPHGAAEGPHGAAEGPHGDTEKPHGAAENLRALHRSRDERMLAGVLGGLGERLGIDPVLLRIVTVVLAIFGGVGIVMYAAGWLLIPEEGTDRSVAEQALGRSDDRAEPATLWLAGGLVLAVLFAAGATFGSGVGTVLLVLAAAGVIVLLRRDGDAPASRFADSTPNDAPADHAPDGTTPAATSPPAAGRVPGDTADSPDAEQLATQTRSHSVEPPADTADEISAAAGQPADESHSAEPHGDTEAGDRPEYVHSFAAAPASAWPDPPDWPASDIDQTGYEYPAPPAESEKPASSHLGSLTLSAVAVALGVLAIVDAAAAAIPASAYVALALAIIGAGLLIGTWFGRARGLIAWGLIGMFIALPATAAGDFLDWEFGGEDRIITIDHPAQIPDGPRSHGIGRVVYDLSELELAETDEIPLDISQSVGSLQLIVPPEVDVTVNASTGMGHIAAFDEQAGGHQDIQVINLGADGEGGGKLTLNLDLGLGEILVGRAGDVPERDVTSPAGQLSIDRPSSPTRPEVTR